MTFLLLTGALVLGANGPAAGQLAQTPWPMFQHDVQHTGRSSLLGPLFLSGAPAPADVNVWQSFGMIASSPTIASDGTIYVGVDVPRPPTSAQGYLCAINPDMTLKWGRFAELYPVARLRIAIRGRNQHRRHHLHR